MESIEFTVTPEREPDHCHAKITTTYEHGILTMRIDDMFGDNAVISLDEPQRSEFIKGILAIDRKIKREKRANENLNR